MTPCEKLGYKVGDEFEVSIGTDSVWNKGDIIRLVKDDGSDCVRFKSSDGQEHHMVLEEIRPLPINLRPGDYCSTANMTGSEYHAVAAAFMAAGCDEGEYPDMHFEFHKFFGWGEKWNGLYHGSGKSGVQFTGRHLTPAQIIGAVNARTEESNMQNNDGWIENTGTCPVEKGTRIDVRYRDGSENLGVKAMAHPAGGSNPDRSAGTWSLYSGDTSITHYRLISEPKQDKPDIHPIDNLNTRRQARDEAEREYQAALAEAREAYPWIRVEEKLERPTEDLTDPANWRAGDVVQCAFGEYAGYREDSYYSVQGRLEEDGRISITDDEGEDQSRLASNFRFIRRP